MHLLSVLSERFLVCFFARVGSDGGEEVVEGFVERLCKPTYPRFHLRSHAVLCWAELVFGVVFALAVLRPVVWSEQVEDES